MDSLSFFKSLAKATHETTSHLPLDNDGNCPFCMNPFYETKSEIHEGINQVECLNCHKVFFISHPRLI